jgi:hypothetical protein
MATGAPSRDELTVVMRAALGSRPPRDRSRLDALHDLRALADFAGTAGLSHGSEAARIDVLRARLAELVPYDRPPDGLILPAPMALVVARVLRGSSIAAAARDHPDDDRVGTRRDYNPQTARRWLRDRAAPLLADWLLARDRAAPNDPLPVVVTGAVPDVVRAWASARATELSLPPAHLRVLGVDRDALRQRVQVLDAGDGSVSAAIDWAEILHRAGSHALDRAIVVALPGYGKSTMLAMAAIDGYRVLAAGEAPAGPVELPVHLDAAAVDRARAGDEPTAAAFVSAAVAVAGSQVPAPDRAAFEAWLRSRLAEATTTLYLDGLDEIPEPRPGHLARRSGFLTALTAFAHGAAARIYLTSRPYDLPDLSTLPFTRLGLQGFDDDEVAAFARAALGAAGASDFLRSLVGRTRQLARIPVLLSFLCLVEAGRGVEARDPARERGRHSRYDLFAAVLERVVGAAWRDSPASTRRRERLLDALPGMAWGLLAGSWSMRFSARQLEAVLGGSLAQDVRDAGIVVPQSGALTFLHPSIGEHLVAAHLVQQPPLRHAAIDAHASDPAWREVWVHLAGGQADDPALMDHLLRSLCEGDAVDVAVLCAVEIGPSEVSPELVTAAIRQVVSRLRSPNSADAGVLRAAGPLATGPLAEVVRDEGAYWQARSAATSLLLDDPDPVARAAVAAAARSTVAGIAAAALPPDPACDRDGGDTAVTELLRIHREHHPGGDVGAIPLAYRLAVEAHLGHVRFTAASSLSHVVTVARIVAGMGGDAPAVAAALAHDTIEDADLTPDDLGRRLGCEVTAIVDTFTRAEQQWTDDYPSHDVDHLSRIWRGALDSDPRVLLVKLADRLHNLRTIAGFPAGSQEWVARETLAVFVGLADELGQPAVASQLRDLATAVLDPLGYAARLEAGSI